MYGKAHAWQYRIATPSYKNSGPVPSMQSRHLRSCGSSILRLRACSGSLLESADAGEAAANHGLVDLRGAVGNRQHTAMNALSSELVATLLDLCECVQTRRDIRAVIITSAGDRAFCAGADLRERAGLSPEEKWKQRTRLWDVNRALFTLPQPLIAAIHGWCLGGGFELALFCELRLATPEAAFSFPEMTLGAYPGAAAAIALPRLIGRGRAKEIFFSLTESESRSRSMTRLR
jgi:1,4-dihydroxy-2-naphthoyl-CoA synthase